MSSSPTLILHASTPILGSPSLSQSSYLQPQGQASTTGLRLLISPSTTSPLPSGHGAERANDEYFQYMYSMAGFTRSDRGTRLAIKIAKTAQRNVRSGRLAAQARIDQCLLMLRVLNEELEDWKWKELEAEQTLRSLEHQEEDF
ncbi:hypothetical protein BD769DRAFT_1642455 [Suillus cothurnatus]|nr:hypothetical protein BD769DRAFT_1642455 [Suillus cothurnatus]